MATHGPSETGLSPLQVGANEGSRSHREHKSIRQDTPAILLMHSDGCSFVALLDPVMFAAAKVLAGGRHEIRQSAF